MSAETRDPITCHVLDTSLGRPARGLRAKLELVGAAPPHASASACSPSTSPSAIDSCASTGPSSSPNNNNNNSSNSSNNISDSTIEPTTLPAAAAPIPAVFESQTDADGRIWGWLPYSSATSSGDVPIYTLEDVLGGLPGERSTWALRFDTAAYFGGADRTFYPEVVVTFAVRRGERYHVPLLLAPFGYTTYRGS